ncbi:MAG TPA: DUF4388 domain-containing protein [Actinomycetota bacterium]|nr:DUF4388 domain-containing protein [Actinomycetota bacterium]
MLKGSLDDFTLPDIFRLMSFAKKTGRVGVTRSAGEGNVYFRDGEVYFAESSLSKEPLGQKLVRSRALSEGQLMKALDEHKASGERLGAVLVRLGAVTAEQLEAAVRQQIEDAVFDLLRWELGEFDWQPAEEIDIEIPIRVSVENLIMEASRRLDEFEVIKRKIPSGDSVLGMAATPPEGAVEINITPDEWRILVLVDGSRTVAQIGQMVGLDEFAAMRVLYGLVSAGLIELIGESGSEDEGETPAAAGEPVATVVAEEPAVEPEPEVVTPAAPEPEAEAVTGSEPVAEQEPVATFEPEPVAAADPNVEQDIPAEPLAEAEPLVTLDPLDSFTIAEDAPVVAAADAGQAPRESEMTPEEMEQFGITPAATTTDAWGETTGVESFDAPKPDELITETPETDPFLADLFGEEAGAPAAPPAPADDLLSEASPSSAPAPPAPVAEEIPVSSAPAGEAPVVDRASVVRELAGLFSEDDRPSARPATPRPRPAAAGAAGSTDEADDRKRVEDDDQVTKGIISRLIDGVKGL